MSSRPRSNYSEEAVRDLIEDYEAHRERIDTHRAGLRYLVWLADLRRALRRLSRTYWEVVLLHGLIGLPQETTAEILQVSQQAVSKRYRRALEEITFHINGGIT